MIEVTLDPEEIAKATAVGRRRQEENVRLGRRPRYGAPTEGALQLNVDGVLAEFAAAKALGIEWRPTALGECDLPGGWEVRSSRSHDNSLILHKGDDGAARFVFVTGEEGSHRVHGWIFGREGKRDVFWRDPTGQGRWAYFVPQKALCPLRGPTQNGASLETPPGDAQEPMEETAG